MPLTTVETARILTVADAVVAQINTLNLAAIQNGLAAVRGYSFGFTDSELNKIQIVVRPEDYANEDEENRPANALTQIYKIQIGVLRKVPKRTTVQTDPVLNIAVMIARMFNVGKFLTVGSDSLQVVGQRFMPLYRHDANTLDNDTETQVRFDSRLDVDFQELERPLAEAT